MALRRAAVYQQYIFVLWGERFEEITASLFVAGLREAGLRVKMLGLTGPSAPGMYGLMLGCDLTLSQALPLASQTVCVILPCGATCLDILLRDPRTLDFFARALANNAKFIVSHAFMEQHVLDALPDIASIWEVCPNGEGLSSFVHHLAQTIHQCGVL